MSSSTKEQENCKFRVASAHTRTFAFLVDNGIFILVFRFFIIPYIYPKNWDTLALNEIINHIVYYFLLAYTVYMAKDFWNGQSFGKWLLCIKVSQVTKGLPAAPFFRLWLRNIFLLILPVELFMFLFSSLHRRLGDKFAGTVVILNKKNFVVRDLTNRVLAVLLIIALLATGYWLTNSKLIEKSSFYSEALVYLKDPKNNKLLKHPWQINYFKELYMEDDRKNVILIIDTASNSGSKKLRFLWEEDPSSLKFKITNVKISTQD